jgi:tetratricopeptide (TPR) repeat protein
MQDRHQEALECYHVAVDRDPRSPEARYRLARALRAAGLARAADDAVTYHEQLLELGVLAARVAESAPEPALLAQVARLCHSLGRDREARAWYSALLRVAPSDGEARRFLDLPALPANQRVNEIAAGQRWADEKSRVP